MKKEENIILNWYEKMREDIPELKKEFISEGSLLYWLAEKQIINFAHSSTQLKENEAMTFKEWCEVNRYTKTKNGKYIYTQDVWFTEKALLKIYNLDIDL